MSSGRRAYTRRHGVGKAVRRHADRKLLARGLHARTCPPVARVREELEVTGRLALRAANRDGQEAHRRARLSRGGEDPDPADHLRNRPAVPVETEHQPLGPPGHLGPDQREAAVVVDHVPRERESRLGRRLGDVLARRHVRAAARPVEAQGSRREGVGRPGERALVHRGALDRGVPELDVPPVGGVSPVRAVQERVGDHRHLRPGSELAVDPVEDDALVDGQRPAAGSVGGEEPVEGQTRLDGHGEGGDSEQDDCRPTSAEHNRRQHEDEAEDDRREREHEPGAVDRTSDVEERAVQKRDR